MSRKQIGLGLTVGLLAALGGLWGHATHPPASRFVWAAGSPVAVTAHPPAAPAAARPAVAPPPPNYRLTAPPSVSAATIDRILAEYGSPAAGQGVVFYDLGLQYGIDPAYALAFYIVESHAGTQGVARFTHSIGNIRVTPGYASYDGYRSYTSYAAGIADWYALIRDLYIQRWGLTTPGPILARYAPWGDGNNPAGYAATVTTLVAGWPR